MLLSHGASRVAPVAILVGLVVTLLAPGAHAHGIWGHIHVTGWAIEELPDGTLKELLAEPEVLNAALFGASFPDSGYFPIQGKSDDDARAYAELTHWEPFIHRFIEWIRTEDPPPWDDIESRKRVAFLLGCASHGLQDEVFDSLYLDHTAFHEGGTQETVDPGTDGFLALEGQLRFVPQPWIPLATLEELYGDLGAQITGQLIESATEAMTALYVNDSFGLEFAASLGESYESELPWSRAHFLDPDVMGSLASEIGPTQAYMEAIWERLHAGLDSDATVVATMPPEGFELSTGAREGFGTRLTWIYGVGVHRDSALVTCMDAAGEPVVGGLTGTRWNAEYTRLHSFRPAEDLTLEGALTCVMEPGLERIDEVMSEGSHGLTVRVPCWAPQSMVCPALDSEQDAGSTPHLEPDHDEGSAGEGSGGCRGGGSSGWPVVLAVVAAWWLVRRLRRRVAP